MRDDGRLIVYYDGHACKDADGQVFLAPKDFRFDQPAVNGRPLQWLVDLVEDCPAKEKLLLLDGSHVGTGAEQAAEPSLGRDDPCFEAAIQSHPVTEGLRPGKLPEGAERPRSSGQEHGLFAWCLAEGYGGAADANRNTLVEPTGLFAYLQKEMPAAAAQGTQTPELFLPDDRPPRLTDAARGIDSQTGGLCGSTQVQPGRGIQEYDTALQAAGAKAEPRLLFQG